MKNNLKKECRSLLDGYTAKLFFISTFSFVVRYGGFAGILLLFHSFSSSDFFVFLKLSYSSVIAYSIFIFLFSLTLFLFLLICTNIKQNENYCYYLRTEKIDFKLSYLFRSYKISFVFKTFLLYLKAFVLKLLWLLYFCVPCLLYFLCCLPFLKAHELPQNFHIIILLCGTILFSLSFIMWRIACLQYFYNKHSVFTNEEKIKSTLINKTDLKTVFLLKCSFVCWLFSYIFIIPVFFIIPYKKLCFTSAYKSMPL